MSLLVYPVQSEDATPSPRPEALVRYKRRFIKDALTINDNTPILLASATVTPVAIARIVINIGGSVDAQGRLRIFSDGPNGQEIWKNQFLMPNSANVTPMTTIEWVPDGGPLLPHTLECGYILWLIWNSDRPLNDTMVRVLSARLPSDASVVAGLK